MGNEEEESRENLDFCWPQIKRPRADEETVALVGRSYTDVNSLSSVTRLLQQFKSQVM